MGRSPSDSKRRFVRKSRTTAQERIEERTRVTQLHKAIPENWKSDLRERLGSVGAEHYGD
ncbi:MAG: hypothetical protein KIS92_20570 [Planctomycetota bacterium]|nr:hypothetical protein [Planctomycetota bacterium]